MDILYETSLCIVIMYHEIQRILLGHVLMEKDLIISKQYDTPIQGIHIDVW